MVHNTTDEDKWYMLSRSSDSSLQRPKGSFEDLEESDIDTEQRSTKRQIEKAERDYESNTSSGSINIGLNDDETHIPQHQATT
jgi:hypothetical protein